jgi:hypothetical protein
LSTELRELAPAVSAELSGERRYISCLARSNKFRRQNLLLEHFFDLSDLFLNFAGVFFGVAFGLEVRIVPWLCRPSL